MEFKRIDDCGFWFVELGFRYDDLRLYYELVDYIQYDGYNANCKLDKMQFNKVDHVIIDHLDKKIQIDIRR